MPLALSPVTLVPLLSAALLIVAGTALVQRSRGSNRGRGGSRHSGGPRVGSRFAAAPDPRFAAGARFAPSQGARFAPDPRFAAGARFAPSQGASFASVPRFAPQGASFSPAQGPRLASSLSLASDLSLGSDLSLVPDVRLVPGPRDHVAVEPDPRPGSQPDPRPPIPATSWSVSVLAALTEGDKARPDFAPSNSGDAFPTRGRALSLLGGHVLAALGILTLSLASTPVGHHLSHVGNTSVGSLAVLCVLAGFAIVVVAAARVQHDIMGGGWDGGFSPRFISYISPEVALYVVCPSGISAAARRLNTSPARVILVEYGLLVVSVLIVLHHYVAR